MDLNSSYIYLSIIALVVLFGIVIVWFVTGTKETKTSTWNSVDNQKLKEAEETNIIRSNTPEVRDNEHSILFEPEDKYENLQSSRKEVSVISPVLPKPSVEKVKFNAESDMVANDSQNLVNDLGEVEVKEEINQLTRQTVNEEFYSHNEEPTIRVDDIESYTSTHQVQVEQGIDHHNQYGQAYNQIVNHDPLHNSYNDQAVRPVNELVNDQVAQPIQEPKSPQADYIVDQTSTEVAAPIIEPSVVTKYKPEFEVPITSKDHFLPINRVTKNIDLHFNFRFSEGRIPLEKFREIIFDIFRQDIIFDNGIYYLTLQNQKTGKIDKIAAILRGKLGKTYPFPDLSTGEDRELYGLNLIIPPKSYNDPDALQKILNFMAIMGTNFTQRFCDLNGKEIEDIKLMWISRAQEVRRAMQEYAQ